MAKHLSQSLEETKDLARLFLDTVNPRENAYVVALKGDLGAGKTAFTQAVGEILGVKENLVSPTFVIEKIYPIAWRGFKNLIHIDVYRLERDEEILHLGWEEITKEPENLIFIEWPERVSGVIPSDAREIQFTFIDETKRYIEYEDERQ